MIFRSRWPEPSIPDQHLPGFVLAAATDRADRTALVDAATGRRISYGQLEEQVRAFAAGLSDLGVRQGDVVAILLPNLPEYPVVFLGTALAGATNTTLNPSYTSHEIAAQLADSGARVLVTVAELLEKARTAAPDGMRLIVVGESDGPAIPLARILAAETAAPPPVEIDPAVDVAALPYSSGTTGLPKGVMLSHRNLVANAVQCEPFFVDDDDVVLAVAPFFHIMGMTVLMLGALSRGLTLVTMARFDLEQFLTAIQRHRVTTTIVPPPITVALAKHPLVDGFDLSSLRLVMTGGAPLGADAEEACAARLRCRVGQGWGMTELAGAGSASPPPGLAPGRPGSVGWCVAGGEFKLVDPASGAELAADGVGELWFRGPNVMRGYLHRPEATAATITADGWCRTGDVCRVDDEGFLYVVDRLKELIKYKGFHVAPAELEALLIAHPLIADAAVVASPDPEAGEVPKAFLVAQGDTDPETLAADVLAHLAERVAPYKRVRRYEFVDSIPRTPSGKIMRRTLIERERGIAGVTVP
jgi:acyl-CoA synthetase (AMP-forming)/AMP-acid ligase II